MFTWDDLEVGDTLQLNCGGPRMTLVNKTDTEGLLVWFSTQDVIQSTGILSNQVMCFNRVLPL